jgi:hypothetical protein
MNEVETIQLQQQEEEDEDEDEDVNGDLGHASKNLITSFWLLGGWLAASWPPPPGWEEEEEALTHKSVAKAKALTSALSLFSRARVRCGRYRDEKDAKLLVDPTREYSEILRVFALFPTAKNVQQSKQGSRHIPHAPTHARTLAEQQHS